MMTGSQTYSFSVSGSELIKEFNMVRQCLCGKADLGDWSKFVRTAVLEKFERDILKPKSETQYIKDDLFRVLENYYYERDFGWGIKRALGRGEITDDDIVLMNTTAKLIMDECYDTGATIRYLKRRK